ncbi:MAG TPA: hypothetical protein VMU39_03415 [Solirubrobacteraceae bacterium]|nr:hypothetical protein [Solirubrobacteraceae bacterium]
MNPEDVIVTQMGLLLSQVRYARHALEDIERSTAHYAGLTINLGAAGTAIGAPPLVGGALAVYITNISELTSGGGGGGFFEALFGGIGRLFGGLIGGLFGGAIGALALPFDLVVVERIVRAVERIMPMVERVSRAVERVIVMLRDLGILSPRPQVPATAGTGGGGAASAGESTTSQLIRVSDSMTRALDLAGRGPAAGAPEATGGAREWLMLFRELRGVVDGLILLVPILVGAIAALLYRLTDIKREILGLLIFAVENLLVLRGIALVTIFDTIAAAAALAAQLLAIVATAVDRILLAIITAIGAALDAAEAAVRLLGDGLKATIDALMTWLRDGLGNFLIFLGNTRVFRLIYHIVDILPLVLPALLRLLGHTPEEAAAQAAAAVIARGGTQAAADAAAAGARAAYAADLHRLDRAAARAFPGLTGGRAAGVGGPAGGGTIAPFPNVGDLALPPAATAAFRRTLEGAEETIRRETGAALGAARTAMTGIEHTARRALDQAPFEQDLARQRQQVAADSRALADALRPAEDALARREPTGLDAVAQAYERWLTGGGMTSLMQRITDHFQRAPLGEQPERSVLGRIVDAVTGQRVRATVEIGELVVELGPAGERPTSDLDRGRGHDGVSAWASWARDVADRGGLHLDPDLHPASNLLPA